MEQYKKAMPNAACKAAADMALWRPYFSFKLVRLLL